MKIRMIGGSAALILLALGLVLFLLLPGQAGSSYGRLDATSDYQTLEASINSLLTQTSQAQFQPTPNWTQTVEAAFGQMKTATAQAQMGAAAPVDLPNLLENGGFEANHIRPWRFFPEGDPGCEWTTEYPNVYSGSHMLSTFRPEGSPCQSLAQDVTIAPQPGDTYTLAARIRWGWDGTPRAGRLALWALGGAEENSTVNFSVQGAWECVQTTLTIQGTNHAALRAEVYLDSVGQPDTQIDDVRLVRGAYDLCTPFLDSASVLGLIQNLGPVMLTASQFGLNIQVVNTATSPDTTLTMQYTVHIAPSLNLAQVTAANVQVQPDGTVSLTLPPLHLADCALDDTQVVAFECTDIPLVQDCSALLPPLITAADRQALENTVTHMSSASMIAALSDHASQQLRPLLAAAGITQITILPSPGIIVEGTCAAQAQSGDPNGPTVEILAPANGDMVTLGAPIAVRARAQGASGVTSIELRVNGVTVSQQPAPVANSTSLDAVLDYMPSAAGSYTLTVQAYSGEQAGLPVTIAVNVTTATLVTAPTSTAPFSGVCQALVASGLYLREGPGTQYTVITSLQPSDVPIVLGYAEGSDGSGQWLKLQVGDLTGWAHAEYIQLLGDCTNLQPTT